MLGRKRFADLVSRQLDLFEQDEADLLDEADEADDAWTNAGRADSEELFGDYQLVADAIGERLLDVRETYAASLDGSAAAEYRRTFTKAAANRFPAYSALLLDEA